MRIGFVGTENSHVQHFLRFLNIEGRYPGVRGAALSGGRSARNLDLATSSGVELIVDEPAELLGQVDAAIVSSRDGADHLAHARPLLEAGIPVLVDKPLAASVDDAATLVELARANDTQLVSCSALRFVPEIDLFPGSDAGRGPIRHLHVIGPADPDSDYSGLFFYGIHHVEAALELLGNPIVTPDSLTVAVDRRADTAVASTRIADTKVTFTFVVPGESHRVPFHATAVYADEVISHRLSLGPDYNAPALEEFLRAIDSGTPRLSDAHLLSPVATMAAIAAQL